MLNIRIIKETDNPASLDTANYLKKLFENEKSIKDGWILIVCDLTCYGFKEKDIDLFVVGKISQGFLLQNLITDYENNAKSKVFINSFCFIIKEIRADAPAIIIDDEKIIIKVEEKEYDVSSYSDSQNHVIRDFIKGTTGLDIYTFNMFLFKNLSPRETTNEKYNTLRPNFTLNHIFQNQINSGARLIPNKSNAYNLYAAKNKALDLDLIEKSVSTFGQIKKSIGTLTKKKLNLLTEQFLKGQKYSDQIGKMPVIIRGPAGSGKTIKLIGIAKDLYLQNKSCLFLTYNQALVKDLTRLITIAEIKSSYPGPAVVIDSIHSLLYRTSESFGIMAVILQTRVNELKNKFNGYHQRVLNFYKIKILDEGKTKPIELRIEIKRSSEDKITKKKLLSFLTHCAENKIDLENCDLDKFIADYYDSIFSMVIKSLKNNLFLNNFFVIRKHILSFLNKDFSFITNNDLFNDPDFVQFLIKRNVSIASKEESLNLFNEYIEKVITRIRTWDYVFIDEAQDWHREEREIIYSLFGTSMIIISDGLKQQLIRSSDYLNWDSFNGQDLRTGGFSLNKSLRQKENLSRFQNAFAKATNVSWNVESDERLEKGRIIISTIGLTKEIYSSLNQVGIENLCDSHDSLIFLIPPSLSKSTKVQNIYVGENDDIIDDQKVVEREFYFKSTWETQWNILLWDGSKVDKEHISKKSLPLPLNEQHRVFHYESSRGLEAWTVVCLEMDELFDKKFFYYETPEGQQLTYSKEDQAKMFAANWCLIAMSRAVDTLVITINNKNSELASILRQASSYLGDNVTWIENSSID